MCYTYDELSRVTAKTVKSLADDTVISTETFAYDAANLIADEGRKLYLYNLANVKK